MVHLSKGLLGCHQARYDYDRFLLTKDEEINVVNCEAMQKVLEDSPGINEILADESDRNLNHGFPIVYATCHMPHASFGSFLLIQELFNKGLIDSFHLLLPLMILLIFCLGFNNFIPCSPFL